MTSPYNWDKTGAIKLDLPNINKLRIGASWQASGSGTKGLMGKLKKLQGVDLDLVCVASQGRSAKRLCWFDLADPFGDGSLLTLGDDTRGRGHGDNETIVADLQRIPSIIDRLTFFMMAYKQGVDFGKVSAVTVRVYDDETNQAQGSFMPDLGSRKNAIAVCQANRLGLGWSVDELNEMIDIPVSGDFGNDQPQIVRVAERYHRA